MLNNSNNQQTLSIDLIKIPNGKLVKSNMDTTRTHAKKNYASTGCF